MVLDQGNELLQEGSVTDEHKDQVKSYIELVEDTIGMLENFLDVSDNETDRIVWENSTGQYRLILVAFNNILLHRSRSSVIFCGKSDFRTNDLQGIPRFTIPT